MKLPFNYAVRNLWRRPFRATMTAFGVGIVIFAAMLMVGLSLGIYQRIDVTGEEENLILISKKGTNMMMSNIDEDAMVYLASLPNVTSSITGELMISPEVYDVCYISQPQVQSEAQSVYVRGLKSLGYEVHHAITLEEGRLPEKQREVLVGRSAWVKLGVKAEDLRVDSKIKFEREEWTICGVFSAEGSIFESEVWADLDELLSVRRRNNPSCITVRFQDKPALENSLPAFSESGTYSRYFKAIPEKAYYRASSGAIFWIYGLSLLMSVAVIIVGLLIGINTMYANIMNRRKEVATYQVLGFTSFDILCTFVNESVVMTGMGGVCGILLGLLADGIPLSTGAGAFFIIVDWRVVLVGMVLTFLIGFFGAFIPLMRVLSVSALDNLRS